MAIMTCTIMIVGKSLCVRSALFDWVMISNFHLKRCIHTHIYMTRAWNSHFNAEQWENSTRWRKKGTLRCWILHDCAVNFLFSLLKCDKNYAFAWISILFSTWFHTRCYFNYFESPNEKSGKREKKHKSQTG